MRIIKKIKDILLLFFSFSLKELVSLFSTYFYFFFSIILNKPLLFFYNGQPIHFSFVESTLDNLVKSKRYFIIILNEFPEKIESRNFQLQLRQKFHKFLIGKYLITPASMMKKGQKPIFVSGVIDMFHSPVSTHMIYPDGTFDNFDIFFCAGPHHEKELKEIFKQKNIGNKRYFHTGYGRLDYLKKRYDGYQKQFTEKTVLIAPSWFEQNILNMYAEQIIERLLNKNFRVILRPHPLMFEVQKDVIDNLYCKFKTNKLFVLEGSNVSKNKNDSNSFFEADVLITDWSGTSFEFFALRKKPVVFIDTPKKIWNDTFDNFNIVPLEESIREKIGLIVGEEKMGYIDQIVGEMMNQNTADFFRTDVDSLINEIFYNPFQCGIIAAQQINELCQNEKSN
ncbi:CDP-glycerol glycerophosphotransferase family protein [Patescibacteria group bacterium]|nr:CDP-glycerol glycerophosphotransferase family protein [Patescibacteria group bacterium]MBU1963976.1 CDP-glycerol glycerophosphotransferase family protein [Patescibacteria group bacterium]